MLKSAISYFELITHGSCIENFSIADGAIILLISNIASKNELDSDIFLINSPPYIQFLSAQNCHHDTLTLIRGWQGVSSALSRFSKKKIENIERIEKKFLKLLDQYIFYIPQPEEVKDIQKSRKNVSKLIESTKNLLTEVNEFHQIMIKFVTSFKSRKQEIEKLGETAAKNCCFSGEKIVHYILTNHI